MRDMQHDYQIWFNQLLFKRAFRMKIAIKYICEGFYGFPRIGLILSNKIFLEHGKNTD